jgi:hypothetical protein
MPSGVNTASAVTSSSIGIRRIHALAWRRTRSCASVSPTASSRAAEVAVEVQSDSDEGETWEAKLRKYPKLGVRELVAFDPERGTLQVWDFVENDLVERKFAGNSTPSRVLPGHWIVLRDAERRPTLRLSRDEAGEALFPTPAEAEAEARKAEAEALHARIRELEAELTIAAPPAAATRFRSRC